MPIAKQWVVASGAHTGKHPKDGLDQPIEKDLVLRGGYSDFLNDGTFDAVNEKIVTKDVVLPDIRVQNCYYNALKDEFQATPP